MNLPTLVVALGLACRLTASAQDYIEPWSDCKKGSSITQKNHGESAGFSAEGIQVKTVKAATRDEIAIEDTLTMEPAGSATQHYEIPLKGLAGSSAPTGKTLGEEKLEIEGKTYACVVRTYETSREKLKAWIPKGIKVPGNALKVEISRAGGKVKVVRRALALAEEIKIGKRTLRCVLFEEERVHEKGSWRAQLWWNGEVPGFAVKTVTREVSDAPGAIVTTEEVTEFTKK